MTAAPDLSFETAAKVRRIPPFPERGRYRTWATDWSPLGYADTPHYRGQLPIRFPPEWAPYQCFLARDWPLE